MSGPKSAHRAARILVVIISLLLVVVLAERWRWFARLESIAQPSLTWIWAPVNPNEVKARAFYAVRDFALATRPAEARLEVLGDPEYIVYLNGARVGSGSYRADAPLDVYEVSDLLVAGSNRVVIELRSPIGSGGATLRIASEGRTLVATGGDWSIQETTWQGALSRKPLSPSSNAEVLGVSPFGRWGTPESGEIKRRFGDLVSSLVPRGARRFRLPYGNGIWQRQSPVTRRSRGVGPATEFDFGAEVEGYLFLAFVRSSAHAGLLRAGSDPASGSGWLPDSLVITIKGSGAWRDAVPRRFRYVEVVGLRGLRWAGVYPLHPGEKQVLAQALPLRGLFNLKVDPQRWPVVDKIWMAYVDRPRVESNGSNSPTVRHADGARTPGRRRARAGHRSPEKH